MNECDRVIPGLILAAGEGRIDDATELAEALLDGRDPISAITAVAMFVSVLNNDPDITWRTIAQLWMAHDAGMILEVPDGDS